MKEQPEFPRQQLTSQCQAQSSNKMVMGFWKIPTCQWDGRYTSMVPSGNVVFIDLQPSKSSTIC